MAPALNLPAPKNEAESGLDGTSVKSKAARIEDVDELTEQSSAEASGSGSAAKKYATGGIIYPPPELRAIVDKTANYVARNGLQFESKIKGDGSSSRLAFLNDDDSYNAYYRAKIEAIRDGTGPLAGAQTGSAASVTSGDLVGPNGEVLRADGEGPADAARQEAESSQPKEPAPYQFTADLPAVTALDLDIVKLTALFVARRGRSFASALAAREGRSYQFEFLRPTHSLFGFFNKLVEQYRIVMEPPTEVVEAARRGAFATTEELPEDTQPVLGIGRGGARLGVLSDIEERAAYQRWERERRKMAEDEQAKERAAFDEIDWNDFVVAGTVEITETDAHIDLPPPMSLREVRNMSMAQKRMAAMIMEVEGGTEAEALDAVGLVDRVIDARGDVARHPAKAQEDVAMDEDNSDDEAGPAKAAPAAASTSRMPGTSGPIKVRKDYQPKTLAQRKAAAAAQSTTCPVCGQSVPISEMDEHVRIELLNPQFREQRRDLERKLAQHSALLEGANPSEALRQFAGKRTDIFGGAAEEEAQKRREQEEARKRKERETMVWDGHAASRVDTTRDFHNPEALQQDMAHIQKRFRTDEPKTIYGPQITSGQDAAGDYVPPVPVEMPQGAATFAAAPVAAPPGNMGGYSNAYYPQQPQGPPPNMGMYGGYYSGPPMPPHMQAQNGTQSPGPQQPMSPHIEGAHTHAPMLTKNADGTLHSEAAWLQSHPTPIAIRIQLPSSTNISAKCDGSQVTLRDMPLTTTIGVIRDRLQAETFEGGIGASRLKLRVDGTKATTLRQTLAHWNLEDGDVLTLTVS